MFKRLTVFTALSVGLVYPSFHVLDNGNVGNGKEYHFTISNVSGDEIHGIPVNGPSADVKGILLYTDEIPFMADEGDRIGVTWGTEEDEFQNIRLIKKGEN